VARIDGGAGSLNPGTATDLIYLNWMLLKFR
jgi:hypothetical protein